ncbi:MAG: AIR synthase family protein [Clostridium sp.]|nr:AIR synthase family protein [Clostridium sp.]
MKIGKLQWKDLNKIINENRGITRTDVRISGGIGEDCSVVNFGEYECVLSTDPITAAENNVGKLAVHINANDIASCGVEPIGILVTILAPINVKLEEIESVMSEIDTETRKLNMQILGGHTEVTDAVNRIIVSCTVIGRTEAGMAISTSGAKEGDEIVVTKHLCLEGTSILVNDYYNEVIKTLSYEEVEEAKKYIDNLSVVKEGKIAGKFGANSMHDITEGGILGALWEVAEGSNVGFKLYNDRLPITDITKKVCRLFNIDPLKFISSGSMVITCKEGDKLVEKLKENGVQAAVVGEIIKSDKILVIEGKEELVPPPEEDELLKVSSNGNKER